MKSLWKALCLLICYTIYASVPSVAQCSNTLQSITYDTLITGNGNNTHSIALSQFNPSIGTLISANINSTITVNYGFTLKNVESVQRDFSVSIGRYDQFSSTALSSSYTNLIDTNIGDFILDPGQTASKAPYTVLYRYSQNDSVISNVVDFLGTSKVNFNYVPITYTTLTGSNVYYYSASADDTIRFKVTYYYCSNVILGIDLKSFSADKINPETVKLSWTTTGSQAGVKYEIEESGDASYFSSIGYLSGNSVDTNYFYNYQVKKDEKSKIYFRLKFITASGQVEYSAVKEVDISGANFVFASAYPNPANNYINISLDKDDWDISLFSCLGNRIQENHFSNTSLAHIDFKTKLSSGLYFVKAQSTSSKKQLLVSFVVQ
ncbi:MAG TPA: T9SS type A sorting domain-containing protein [Puia sp.]|nr:T9SS type A sorting domain-containing protein [Puia sp.]